MKQNSKRNRTMTVGLIVLVLAVATSCIAGFTYAKYTSKVDGNASGSIAAWSWTVNTVEGGSTEKKFAMTAGSIIDTVDGAGTLVAGATNSNVAANRVAPGTKGSYTFTITNASEVNGQYAIDYTVTEDMPIKFYSDEACTNELTDVEASDDTKLTMTGDTTSKEITIYWKWDFSVSDEQDVKDTAFATKGADFELVKATVTFTQVD